MTEAQKASVRESLDAWSDVADITFVELQESDNSDVVGTMRFGFTTYKGTASGVAGWATGPGTTNTPGDVWIATSDDAPITLASGTDLSALTAVNGVTVDIGGSSLLVYDISDSDAVQDAAGGSVSGFYAIDDVNNEAVRVSETDPGVYMPSGEAGRLDDTRFEKGYSQDFLTLLHEIGHALGLAHPFEDELFEGADHSDADEANWVKSPLDHQKYSVMSILLMILFGLTRRIGPIWVMRFRIHP